MLLFKKTFCTFLSGTEVYKISGTEFKFSLNTKSLCCENSQKIASLPNGTGIILFIDTDLFFEIISTISVFNKFDIQTRKNHQNINFLLGADIAEGYRFSQLGMLYYDADLTILWTSELFEERHVQLLGQNLLDWQPVLNELLTSEDKKKEVILTIQQRKYSAICLKELQIRFYSRI